MKLTVVGAGTAGCFTALYCAWYGRKHGLEVEVLYDPDIPPEPVGQATLLTPPHLLFQTHGFNWYKNPIHAKFKTGILYKGWGKKEEHFHEFPGDSVAMHYCPHEVQNYILDTELFTTKETSNLNIDSIDSDYVFDCRGKPDDENMDDYDPLLCPVNSVLLGRPNFEFTNQNWSEHVATPHGWTFVIPADKSSPAFSGCIGYLYNKDITSREEAEENFQEMFDVTITAHKEFNNYVAKEPVTNGGRVLKNGNRLFFLEPLESTATEAYIQWADNALHNIILKDNEGPLHSRLKWREPAEKMIRYIDKLQNFALLHYSQGSKYDTPFWHHAQKLSSEVFDGELEDMLDYSRSTSRWDIVGADESDMIPYAQWAQHSIKNWTELMDYEPCHTI